MNETERPFETLDFFWGDHAVPNGGGGRWRLNRMELWCRMEENECWLAQRQLPPEAAVPSGLAESEPPDTLVEAPSDLEWNRWAAPVAGKVRFTPVLPSRPLVVSPAARFHLAPRARARIYVSLPVWVRVEAAGAAINFTEIPSRVLSDTWFGGFTDGQLCYWLGTEGRRSFENKIPVPHIALCPIHLSNKSPDHLPVEKFLLGLDQLNLYDDGKRLWTDEVRIAYRGGVSGIDIGDRPPPEALGAKRVSEARKPIRRSIAVKTFASLYDMTGLDSLMG